MRGKAHRRRDQDTCGVRVTVNKYATQAGKAFERELMVFFRERGYEAERLRLAGAEDEGDLVVLSTDGKRRFIIEAKRTKGLDLAGWVKEAKVERQNYAAHRSITGGMQTYPGFMVVHYARGKGVGESYVTLTLNEFLGMCL
jgi:HJR/Mrr/RecB family endonuclease